MRQLNRGLMITRAVRLTWVLLLTMTFGGLSVPGWVGADEADKPDPFPLRGLMPKQETNAEAFLKEHPEYDGRGVVVAVFDTGVDPGAEGLQTTSDGQRKIVDVVDATGSGDVDTSTVREATDGVLVGLSGRKLRIPENWNNPTGKYHVGMKAAYELFPRVVVPRLKAKRKELRLPKQRVIATQLERQLADWDAAHPTPSTAQRRVRDELAARLKVVRQMQAEYRDPGPVFDCVVFHDGEVWRASIDTDGDGKFDDERLLTDYRRELEYGTFGSEDLVNFALNIYEQGNLLSVVVNSGAHGTHVAGIIAGNYPKQPELNGIAPGARIVSVKIGDTRVGTRSLGTGSIRGVIAALRNKCDLINMSYGGATPEPNRGRITNFYREIVDRHGVIFVASAGNNGPALTTVGSPGGTTSALLGVGAVISPNLMKNAYSLRASRDEELYTWSSRGPTSDGDLGVDISAPGGAFAPVPRWALQRNMSMNGTSMSSPNACGGIALLLSALKARKVFYTPYSVREAIMNTARQLVDTDRFSQGQGMLQVDTALDYLTAHTTSRRAPLRYDVTLPQQNGSRGVYLREPNETEQPLTTLVSVKPVFHQDAKKELRVGFNQRLRIQCDAPWVETPEFLLLPHGGRSFSIRIDPTGLESGLHATQLRAFDADAPERGPVWRLPITVIRPEELTKTTSPAKSSAGNDLPSNNSDWRATMTFEPGEIQRRFLAVPPAATWADLTIRAGDNDTSRRIVVHAVQLVPQREFTETSIRQYITLLPGEQTVRSFAVVGGRTLELCLAQFWSSLGEGKLEVELTFHGLVPHSPQLTMDGSEVAARLEVTAALRDDSLAPAAQLKTLRQAIAPSKSFLRPLTAPRDTLPEKRQERELILTYNIQLKQPTTVTPRLALDLLSQAGMELESGLWMVFDANKQLLASGSSGDDAPLPKGKFVLRLQLRHDDPKTLQRFKQATLLLDHALKAPITLNVYASGIEAFRQGAKARSRILRQGDSTALYVASVAAEKLPPDARPGDLLLGELTFGKEEKSLPGNGKRPGGFDIVYRVPPAMVKAANGSPAASGGDDTAAKSPVKNTGKQNSGKPSKDKPRQDKPGAWQKKLEERLAAAKLAELAALRQQGKRQAFEQLAEQLREERDDAIPVLREQIRFLDDKDRKPHLPEIVELADEIIASVNRDALARGLAMRPNAEESEAAKKTRRELEEQKSVLVDALYRKARALAYMDLPPKFGVPQPKEDPVRRHPENKKERYKLFEATFAELAGWVDTTSDPYVLLHIRRERRHGRRGSALDLLNGKIKAQPTRQLLYSKRIDILNELKWQDLRDNEVRWMRFRFPKSYPPF